MHGMLNLHFTVTLGATVIILIYRYFCVTAIRFVKGKSLSHRGWTRERYESPNEFVCEQSIRSVLQYFILFAQECNNNNNNIISIKITYKVKEYFSKQEMRSLAE